MIQKRDISSSRTPEDTERKYGKRIINNEKEAKSQKADLASFKVMLNDLKQTTIDSIKIINGTIDNINKTLTRLSEDVEKNTEKRHMHTNKLLLDSITQIDIDKWNNQFKGEYILLAENITAEQQIENIGNYNLILATINNINIPCFRNENIFNGIVVNQDSTEVVSIEFSENVVINVSHNITKLIGIF